MFDRNLLAVAAPAAATALGLHDAMLGFVLGTAFAVAYAMTAVPLGRLADRGQARRLLIGGAALWTLASIATGLSRGAGELIAARVLLGLGQAAFLPAALTVLVDAADAQARPARLALFTGGSTLGRSGALLGGGLLLAALASAAAGWRWLFVVSALPNLLLIAMLMIVPIAGRDRSVEPAARATASPRTLMIFLLAAAAPIVAGQAGAAWMPTLLVRLHGISAAQAGILAGSVTLVAAPAGQLLGGWLATRWPLMRARPLAVVAAGLWAALLPLTLLVLADSRVAAAAGIGLVNLALGVASFAAIYGWQGLWAAGRRGAGNGAFLATVTLLGFGIGPLLTGALSEYGGGGGAALGRALLVTGFGAAMLATAMAALLLGRARSALVPA